MPTFKTLQEALDAGFEKVRLSPVYVGYNDEYKSGKFAIHIVDTSGGHSFGYEFTMRVFERTGKYGSCGRWRQIEVPGIHMPKSFDVWLTEDTNRIRQKGCFCVMMRRDQIDDAVWCITKWANDFMANPTLSTDKRVKDLSVDEDVIQNETFPKSFNGL